MKFDFREVRPTFALALPIVAGNLSGMLMGWVDTLMVGHLGVIPLAVVAFSLTIWIFFYFLGAGCVLSISIRASESHGARDIPALGDWLSACLMITLFMGILTTALGLLFIQFLPLLGQPLEVSSACVGFYTWIILSMTPSLIWLGLKTFLDALGRPWIGFWILMGSVGINIFFNWLFIFGNWGFPRMEVTGAGIATFIARVFGAIGMILIFLGIPLLRSLLQRILHWKWEAIRDLIHLGIPITLQMLSEIIAFNGGALLIGWLGTIPLAAHQIAITLAGTTYMIPLGIGTALTIRIANILGAGENKRLLATVYGTLISTCAIMACIGAVIICFASHIPPWFVNSQPVQHIATQLLMIIGILQIADGLYMIAQSGLRGLSDVHFPALTTIFAYLGLGLFFAFLLGITLHLQAPGVWMGLFLGSTLSGILCLWRLHKKMTQSIFAT